MIRGLCWDGEKRMRRSIALFAVTIAGTVGSKGCATTHERPTPNRIESSHLLFNPGLNSPFGSIVERSDWPSTTAYPGHGESVSFRATLHDQHGGHDSGRDRYYRRFYSVRTGTVRR